MKTTLPLRLACARTLTPTFPGLACCSCSLSHTPTCQWRLVFHTLCAQSPRQMVSEVWIAVNHVGMLRLRAVIACYPLKDNQLSKKVLAQLMKYHFLGCLQG
eukprot:3921863-Amphidinium_carterae.1